MHFCGGIGQKEKGRKGDGGKLILENCFFTASTASTSTSLMKDFVGLADGASPSSLYDDPPSKTNCTTALQLSQRTPHRLDQPTNTTNPQAMCSSEERDTLF